MQIWALMLDSFRESRDRKMFAALLIISTIVALSLGCIGFDEKGWSFFFGLYTLEHPIYRLGAPEIGEFYGSLVSLILIDKYIGWVAVGLSLVATAGIFPSFMQSGTIDVVLAKPLSRWKLFLGKYLGSLGFVLIQSTFFVGITFLVIGWRAEVWLWGYLWCIPLLVLFFSYLYAVCVLAGVWFRSTLTSLLVALGFWFLCFLVHTVDGIVKSNPMWSGQGQLQRMVAIAHVVLPKTSDITLIAGQLTGAGSLADVMTHVGIAKMAQVGDEQLDAVREAEAAVGGVSISRSVLSSLGFEAVVLFGAAVVFRRSDF